MEVQLAEAIGGTRDYQNNNNMFTMIKGKRTKRPRQPSPLDLTMASATSSSILSDNSGGGGGAFGATTSGGGSSTIEYGEEEDLANCLILLAQGRKDSAAYECKTCNRSFPSFQALGGHRASHKKAKGIAEEETNTNMNTNANTISNKKKKSLMLLEEDRFMNDCTQLSLQIVPNRFILPVSSHRRGGGGVRVHECSLCGAEFSSGQALGGHMRRHRTPPMVAAAASNIQDVVKISENAMLGLDLNLPAAEEEEESRRVVVAESKFPFASKEQVIVFSAASSLVDCHY